MDIGTRQTPTPLQSAIRHAAFQAGQERRAQRWLAESTGIDEADISRIVNGKDPGPAHAVSIAETLGVSCTACGWPQYEPQAEAA